ncbi:MAG: DHH family phosphoesterase [Patescibacteria group bacterium]
MTQAVKDFAPILKAEILKAQSILMHCHPSPDPDSVGSTLGMKLALESLGKKVTLIKGDSDIPKAFVFPGVETITQKSFDEINQADFDLFLILDSGSPEMITRKVSIVFADSLTTIVIDHHASNPSYGKLNLVDSSYPATGQLVFDLLKEMGIALNHDIALNLFMGIYTDTGGFRFRSTTPETLKIASELTSLAPDFTDTIFTMENSHTKEKLIFEGVAISSLETFCNGSLGMISMSYDTIKKIGVPDDEIYTGSLSQKIRSVVGIDIAATLMEREPGMIKISFRTRDPKKYDVSKLAVMLGGGGHVAAAGVRLTMTMKEAKEKVVKAVQELYNL